MSRKWQISLGIFLTVILVMGVCLAPAAFGASKTADYKFTWRMYQVMPEGDDHDKRAKAFAQEVKERTDGRVDIKVYSGSVLGDWVECFELLARIAELCVEPLDTLLLGDDVGARLFKLVCEGLGTHGRNEAPPENLSQPQQHAAKHSGDQQSADHLQHEIRHVSPPPRPSSPATSMLARTTRTPRTMLTIFENPVRSRTAVTRVATSHSTR